jgi:hypothetical protein
LQEVNTLVIIGAQENVSLFCKEMLHPRQVMKDYLKLSRKYQMRYHNAKYALMQVYPINHLDELSR